jgi:hypothetical protein
MAMPYANDFALSEQEKHTVFRHSRPREGREHGNLFVFCLNQDFRKINKIAKM